jgi:polysaccharide pyruvyl transferase WcaK-like protein
MKLIVFSCANTGNFGDDIAFEGIKQRFSKITHTDPETIRHVIRLNKETVKIVNEYDFLIIGGGEILSNSNFLDQIVENDIKIPYMFLSVGVGSEEDIRPYLDKIHPTAWYARTERDLHILRNCGIRNALVHVDPLYMCYVKKEPNGKIGLNLKAIGKGIDFIDKTAFILDDLISREIKIDLLALNSRPRQTVEYYGELIDISDCDDFELMKGIKERMREKINIFAYSGKDPLQYLDDLVDYDGIVGERLHAVMAACYGGVNFRAIPYHSKIDKFLEMHELMDRRIGGSPEEIGIAIEQLWREKTDHA